jgi:DNA processing protein
MIGVGRTDDRLHDPPAEPSRRVRHQTSVPSESRTWRDVDLANIDPAADRPFWIALSQLPGIGPVGFGRLLHRYGSAAAAWAAGGELLGLLPRMPEDADLALRRLRRERPGEIAKRVEAATRRADGSVLTALDASYPGALTALDARPPVLYVRGALTALDAPCVAIVGTRQASGYGRATATELADELARCGVTVVSGLATGVDGEAHAAAIAAGGRSVAVLPSPLDRVYPPRHRRLADELVASGGALITELAPGQPSGRPDFARRNRIIAGLSMAVVVVEAPDRSGALLTASAAIAYEKELYAVPGPIDAATSRGCNRLIADHQATLVTSAAALLQQIGARRGDQPVAVATLSEAEARVLYHLLRRSGSIEELMERTRLATGALASALTLLETRGLVTSYGGATFHPTLAAKRIGRREPA